MQVAAIAKHNHLRISAQKVKIVIDLIRNKPVAQALAILRNTPKAASPAVEKLLLSAVANAENNNNMDVEALYVAEVFANQGPTMKRIRPRAQGRAFRIFKRTSHITIVLKEKEDAQKPVKGEKGKKKPAKASAGKADAKQEAKASAAKADTKQEAKAEKPAAPKKAPAKKKPAKKAADAEKQSKAKTADKVKINETDEAKQTAEIEAVKE